MMSSKCDICSGQHLTKDHEKATGQSMSNELKAWKFCPECGCRETINDNQVSENSRQCKECEQEWWTDINYWNSRPTEPKTEWISVDDRLPKKSGEYLTCSDYDIGEGSYINTTYFYLNASKCDKCGSGGNGFEQVTHWMPLPDAPICDEVEK